MEFSGFRFSGLEVRVKGIGCNYDLRFWIQVLSIGFGSVGQS